MSTNNKFTKSYGMPYMGSKNLIAEEIINILPTAKYFVDLFGGGGALSHCASLSGKYEKIIYNEIDTNIFNIFKNACLGKYKTFKWLSKEEFDEKLKNNDIDLEMLLFCFGYNIKKGYWCCGLRELLSKDCYSYIFDCDLNGLKNNELLKRYDYEINDDEFLLLKNNGYRERIKCLRYYFQKQYKNKKYLMNKNIDKVLNNDRYRMFEPFYSFKRVLNLSKIRNIEFYNLSYENVAIPDDSVVICDIPYRDTEEYSKDFDYERFYDWCRNNRNMVFINEYSMPDDFYLVKSFKKTQILSATLNSKSTYKEKLFCNRIYEEYGINDLF